MTYGFVTLSLYCCAVGAHNRRSGLCRTSGQRKFRLLPPTSRSCLLPLWRRWASPGRLRRSRQTLTMARATYRFDSRRDDLAVDLLPVNQGDIFCVWIPCRVRPTNRGSRHRLHRHPLHDRFASNRNGALSALREVGYCRCFNVPRCLFPQLNRKSLRRLVVILLFGFIWQCLIRIDIVFLQWRWTLVQPPRSGCA